MVAWWYLWNSETSKTRLPETWNNQEFKQTSRRNLIKWSKTCDLKIQNLKKIKQQSWDVLEIKVWIPYLNYITYDLFITWTLRCLLRLFHSARHKALFSYFLFCFSGALGFFMRYVWSRWGPSGQCSTHPCSSRGHARNCSISGMYRTPLGDL